MHQYIRSFKTTHSEYYYYSFEEIAKLIDTRRLPFSLKILLENILRNMQHGTTSEEDIIALSKWLEIRKSDHEISFKPTRVLMQDFTGVPAVVDLAAMRDHMAKSGNSPDKINPLSPVDLVIDHSVQVDSYANGDAFRKNVELEIARNKERYQFLKWGQSSFNNFRVVPTGTGICHQVNLEFLAKVVWTQNIDGKKFAYPDSLVGTDSHTTMINGLAVLGWGVGGIEAEAAMLGQPISMIIPEVIGFKMHGELAAGVTATDLVLNVTEILRKKNVVGKFVEFFGPGLQHLSVANRATIANMSPEYGATCGFFPIDQETIKYLRLTGRDEELIELVEAYAKLQGMWYAPETPDPLYTEVIELDLSKVQPSLAGPKRPQDRVNLYDIKDSFQESLKSTFNVTEHHKTEGLNHGDVVIAAITSCTNTSNPQVMVAAGLIAKKAIELGLKTKPWVKTSLAPGSKVVSEYLEGAGLQKHLDALGFNLVGYGCTTCIGNSGPLNADIAEAIDQKSLVVASVLSGNRNFEGRIHPQCRANYLASPPLVVIYALTGKIDIDFKNEPIGQSNTGKDIFLKDIWPSEKEIESIISKHITPEMFRTKYKDVFTGDSAWQNIQIDKSTTYKWDPESTYINNPPFFSTRSMNIDTIKGAKILAMFGDSITTDHISPAGDIAKTSPAAEYLVSKGVKPQEFNSYGSRRGNHEVMLRGTFANIRIKNELTPDIEGGVTIYSDKVMSIYDAAMKYNSDGANLVIIAGKEYGTGSSRDWAAKGTKLLGIKAVIAESFERIHRSNLIGMGVLPLTFTNGDTRKTLSLTGKETIDIPDLANLKPNAKVVAYIDSKPITLSCNIFTEKELEYFKHGGILQYVMSKF